MLTVEMIVWPSSDWQTLELLSVKKWHSITDDLPTSDRPKTETKRSFSRIGEDTPLRPVKKVKTKKSSTKGLKVKKSGNI